ncbi:trihelix transcription factor gt-3a [Quercus suber]|uniref:Trihelix transcription factor gt-3a n=1 Tax=Quercus suber TaxID=58331 RepID=A0AAW0LCH4_QUESU
MEGHHPHPHPHHLQHQHQQQQQQHHHISVNVDTSDRFPQWSVQETKEFLMIRAELDRTFMETKRNKLLWEVISTKMKEKGFNRSAEQCKCKWKNLVTRYKRMLWAEAEGAASGSKKKAAQLSSDEEEDIEDSEGEIKGNTRKKIKKSSKSNITGSSTSGVGSGSGNNFNHLKEILDDFMKQQLQIEVQWREAFEARENERRLKEMEWRQHMEALENERILMEQRWREREEQRRMREEARAEKRDALITALLSKIRREDM